MARYVPMHTLACLTRQGAEQLVARMHAATDVTLRRAQVNMIEGKMLVEFEAADRERLEQWLASAGFHSDWILRVEYEAQEGRLLSV